MQAYQAAIRQVMISPSTKKDGGVPDNLSAGAATAFERATSVGDHGAQWVTLVRRTSNTTDLDLVGAMDAGRETSARWAAGQLVGKEKRKGRSVVEFPSAQEIVVHERRAFGRRGDPQIDPGAVRQVRLAEESQVDATWRAYLANPKGTAVKFRPPAGRFGPASTRPSAASTSGASRRPTTRSSTRRPASSSGSRPA